MFIRPCYRTKNGKRHAYWTLVESYRTARGSRQRVVAYLGDVTAGMRRGVKRAAAGGEPDGQGTLFPEAAPDWVEVDAQRVRVENERGFGGPWLGLGLAQRVGLDEFLATAMGKGREEVPWPLMALILVLARLCEPASELHLAEHFYHTTAMAELLGVPASAVNDDRLYRTLDHLLPHKDALEVFLKNRLGTLFKLDYDLLLYDLTSTYFEGEMLGNPQAQRGHSRDQRGDCKQVCIALVVSREGLPLGYEVFPGNTADVTTFRPIIEKIEAKYGKSDRIWVVDRGMVSEANLDFLRQDGRRYLVGTPKSQLPTFARQLQSPDWQVIRDGLEVQLCPSPDGQETFILCRSRDRQGKERAIRERFEQRLEAGLQALAAASAKKRLTVETVATRLGRLRARNSRASRLFTTQIVVGDDGGARLTWARHEDWRQWAILSEGCYVLRSNIHDWSPAELWHAYIQLTQAEAAFRLQKSDLHIRPVWHQKEQRTQAHILVCFLAYVLWKSLGKLCAEAGLGDEPRRVFAELGKLAVVDVVLPTKTGGEIRKRCITRPTAHQASLLQRLGLRLPFHLRTGPM
jgi:transposase